MHTMNTSILQIGWPGMKIDFSKTFDHMEWSFIMTVLINCGLHATLVNWVMQHISTLQSFQSYFMDLLSIISMPQGDLE